MANKTTYTKRDIAHFRTTLIRFLKKYLPPDKKWYDTDNSLTVAGGTLEKFLYKKKRHERYSEGIFKFEGMRPETFHELLSNFPAEKYGASIEIEKDELRAMYESWSEAKIIYQHKRKRVRLKRQPKVSTIPKPDFDVETELAIKQAPAPLPTPTAHAQSVALPIPETSTQTESVKIKKQLKDFLPNYRYGLVLLAVFGIFVAWTQSDNPPIEITENAQWVPIYKQEGDIRLVYVPSGCYTMGYLHGESTEQPVQRLCLEAFWLAETETTMGQYGDTPAEACNLDQLTMEKLVNEISPDSPMNCVTWEEANNFCQSRGMRLPTEAEWEYGARGPSNWLYPWGNDPESTYTIVRIDPNAPRPVMPVGSMSRDTSWVGAKDMAGNVREFTSTIHNMAMGTHTPFEMPYNPDDGRESLENVGQWNDWSGTTRVVKGGNFDLPIAQARSSLRYDEFFDFRFNHYGFRCAMDA